MRLVCVRDDGDTMDVESALQQEPYITRGLLASALFHVNREMLPDTLNFLNAERALRDALESFSGDQEKYVRSYVLARTLDQRMADTPRASVIRFAFAHGGPIAVLGVFYATLNVHRSQRSREVLEYVFTAPEASKLELLARVPTFTCSPHVTGWLGRVFEKLDVDSQGLLCLLRCLGNIDIPQCVFERSRKPSLTWGADGEPSSSPPRLAAIITHEDRLASALQQLDFVGFVRSSDKTVTIDPLVSELLQARLESALWKAESIKVLCHVFPKHPELDPVGFKLQCEALLPLVAHTRLHLREPYVMSFCAQEPQLTQFTETSLSSSYFRDYAWKIKCVSFAEQVLMASDTRESPDTLVLQARVQMRRAVLSGTYESRSIRGEFPCPRIDHRSNAYAANAALLNADACIQLNTLSAASKALESFDPLLFGSASSFEKLRTNQIDLCRARILLLEGKFDAAYALLATLPNTQEDVIVCLAEVLCELGRSDEAEILLASPTLSATPPSIALRSAIARVQLFRCLDAHQGGSSWSYAQETRSMYRDLMGTNDLATYPGKHDRFVSLSGLAILDHLEGLADSAMARWDEAATFCKHYAFQGFSEMIIAYSMGELELRRGNRLEADYLRAKAGLLFTSSGRQYHFLGLGSAWIDIVGSWYESRGYDRLAPQQGASQLSVY